MSVFYGCRYVKLYLQNPDHTFTLKTYYYGLQKLHTGEDVTWVDYNNDGAVDLCSGNTGRIRLFKNEVTPGNHYLTLDIKAAKGNLFAIGSKVVLFAGGQKITRQITAGRGVRHQAPYRLHFGIGTSTVEKVEIFWPDKTTETYSGFSFNRHYNIEQGKPVSGLNQVENELLLSGNPGSQIGIHFMTKNAGNLKIILADATGRIIKNITEEQISAGSKTYLLSGSDLSGGVYWVQALFNGKRFSKKWLRI